MPNEADLAREFGVARATVNRALRSLADTGLIERRRRAGTHVTMNPVRRAVLSIPVIRAGLEDEGRRHSHRLLAKEEGEAPDDCGFGPALHLVALHLADGIAYAYEDRWVNLHAVPQIMQVDLTQISANEWLVGNAPFTHGDLSIGARRAADLAPHFTCSSDTALVQVRRRTWNAEEPITRVDLTFAPGHEVQAKL